MSPGLFEELSSSFTLFQRIFFVLHSRYESKFKASSCSTVSILLFLIRFSSSSSSLVSLGLSRAFQSSTRISLLNREIQLELLVFLYSNRASIEE